MADNSPKMDAEKENVDLMGDFDDADAAPENEEQAELLRNKFDEFFTSESDEIEDELIDIESSDSDSDHGGNISPKSFDELVDRQNKANNS